MAAEPTRDAEDQGTPTARTTRTGRTASTTSTARTAPAPPKRTAARRRAPFAVPPRPANDGAGAHARVEMDGREPLFDHATSHVLVADRATGGRPIGGRKPVHLAEPTSVRLRLARVGPWSAFKLALLFGALAAVALVSALVVLYSLLDAAGVLHAIQKLVNSSGVGHHFRFDGGWILTRVVWVTALMVLIGAVIAACLTVLYNSLADLTGGLDVTFTEHPDTVLRAPEAPTWTARFRGTRLWHHDRGEFQAEDLPRASGL